MTITIPLTKEQEDRLLELAKGRGMSAGELVQSAVRHILEIGGGASNGDESLRTERRDREMEELFCTFDTFESADEISEAAFHRDNWYR